MRDYRKEGRLEREIERAKLTAVNTVKRLFRAPTDPDYNPDADVKWSECSTRTRAALQLTALADQTLRAKETAKQTTRSIAVVAIPVPIASAEQWEAFAAQPPEQQVIEATVIEPEKKSEGEP